MADTVRAAAFALAILAGAGIALAAVAVAEPQPTAGSAPAVRLESILGREVSNRDGDGGRIVDLLSDADGQVRAAVIEFGGFLGIGTRKIAVDWSAVRFVGEGRRDTVMVDVSRDQLRAAPEYKPSDPPVVVRAAAPE